jgi:NitT/TauT family transport system ATP-binding protein
VENVSLRVPDRSIVCLLGPTGCGKSTILRLVAGLEGPDSGRSELISDGGAEGPEVGYLTQRHTLFPWLTAEENIRLPLRIRGGGKERTRSLPRELLETLGLSRHSGLYPHEMSGGMQQRTALGRLLAMEAGCWLLDEPFAALDERTRHQLQDLLVELAGEMGITVLFVTHSIDEAVYIADRIHVFSAAPGRIVETLDLDDSRPRDRLSDSFGRHMERIRKKLEKEIG